MEVSISRTTAEEQEAVDEYVREHFLPDMPLILAFGLQDNPPPRPSAPPVTPPGSFTLKALDSRDQIVGLAINKVNPSFHLDDETPSDVRKMVEMMQFVEKQAQLHRLPEPMIELRVLSVRKDWRQRGLAKRLVEESKKIAREEGFQAMRVCCTSEFTAKLVRSMGWREHYRIKYQDYPSVSGRDVHLQPTPPHEHLYYYVTDL